MFLPEKKKGVATMRSTMDRTPGVKTLRMLHQATAGDTPLRAWLRRQRAFHCPRIDHDGATVDGMTPDDFLLGARVKCNPHRKPSAARSDRGDASSSLAFLKAYRSFQYAEQ